VPPSLLSGTPPLPLGGAGAGSGSEGKLSLSSSSFFSSSFYPVTFA